MYTAVEAEIKVEEYFMLKDNCNCYSMCIYLLAGPHDILYLFLSKTSNACEFNPLVKVTKMVPGLQPSAILDIEVIRLSSKQVELAKMTSPSVQS